MQEMEEMGVDWKAGKDHIVVMERKLMLVGRKIWWFSMFIAPML